LDLDELMLSVTDNSVVNRIHKICEFVSNNNTPVSPKQQKLFSWMQEFKYPKKKEKEKMEIFLTCNTLPLWKSTDGGEMFPADLILASRFLEELASIYDNESFLIFIYQYYYFVITILFFTNMRYISWKD
jgi:hypothetical protein